VKLYWMKNSEAWPGGHWLESDRSCFDEDKPGRKSDSLRDTHVGHVHQIEGDPGGGMWEWRVTARFPGSRFPDPTSGREISCKEAMAPSPFVWVSPDCTHSQGYSMVLLAGPCVHPSWAVTETQSVHVCRVKPVPWWAGTLVWNASANLRSEIYLA
jgi:hypothetical protein